ncbi:MAG: hypothetical protein ABJF05_22275 [Paracoccaceae bacterium]
MKPPPKTRFQFDVTVDRAEDVRDLLAATGSESNKDLFNNALTLLEWAVSETQKGNTIASVDEDNGRYRELQMPILNAARKIAQRREPSGIAASIPTPDIGSKARA